MRRGEVREGEVRERLGEGEKWVGEKHTPIPMGLSADTTQLSQKIN